MEATKQDKKSSGEDNNKWDSWGPAADAPASVKSAYAKLPTLSEAIHNVSESQGEESKAVFDHPWIYKGEGAAHMVLGYNDEHDDYTSPLRGLVLRMLKRGKEGVKAKKASLDSTTSNTNPNLNIEELLFFQRVQESDKESKTEAELQEFAFTSKVMAPLLGSDYVYSGKPVRLTEEFVKKISASIEEKRPAHRREASELDPAALFAFLMPDFTLFPTAKPQEGAAATKEVSEPIICVEIKAKGGFMPFSDLIRAKNAKEKKGVCRYCQYQRLKKEKGDIKEISQYCPLDLFSGDRERVLRALNDIFDVPQNNLKLFLDGELFYTGDLGGHSSADTKKAADGLDEALSKTLPPTEGSAKKTLLNLLTDILLKEALLPNLKNVQMLDYLDVEGVYPIYQKLEAKGRNGLLKEWPEADIPLSDDDSEARKQFVEMLKHPKEHKPSEKAMLNSIRDFAISTTVKDCSTMITILPTAAAKLRASKELHHVEARTEGKESFSYRIAVVDLDPKQLVNMDYWFKNDQDIVAFLHKHPIKKKDSEPFPHCYSV